MLLLSSFILPIYAQIDQVSCGKKETSDIGSGIGAATVDCAPPMIWLFSYDFVLGSHWAIGRLDKGFKTSEAGTYRIYIRGDASGSLGMVYPTDVPILDHADGTAAIDVYARVYERGRETTPYGGEEVSILSESIDDWGELVLSRENFEHYFDVDLMANTQYVVELKAKASTSSAGTESALSKWGPRSDNRYGITWLTCTITPPEAKPTAPGQEGTTPGQEGFAPGREGSTPGQEGTMPPGQEGTTPGQEGSTPGQCSGTVCDGECVDPQTDASNCGTCGNACMGGKECSNGECVCPEGQMDCNGICQECCDDGNCDDGDSCTSDSCNNGVCTSVAKNLPNGELCSENCECASGECDEDNSKCVPSGGDGLSLGSYCTQDSQCASGWCKSWACSCECDSDADCPSSVSYCYTGGCAHSCVQDVQCDSGSCINGVCQG